MPLGGIRQRLVHQHLRAHGVVVGDEPAPVLAGVVHRPAGDLGRACWGRVPRRKLNARVPLVEGRAVLVAAVVLARGRQAARHGDPRAQLERRLGGDERVHVEQQLRVPVVVVVVVVFVVVVVVVVGGGGGGGGGGDDD